jgi:hypothetical protein
LGFFQICLYSIVPYFVSRASAVMPRHHDFEYCPRLLAESRYKDDALQTACLKGAAEIFQYLIDTLPYR